MLKTFFAAILAVSLTACSVVGPTGSIPAPVELADRTAKDEQAAIAIENGYKAFRLAVELGVDTGVIKGERAAAVAKADQCAYAALLVFRQAYKTANSADLVAAGRNVNAAIDQAIAAVKGKASPCSL